MGSMTGRGAGFCAGNAVPGIAAAGVPMGRGGMGFRRGCGFGAGRGAGRGFGGGGRFAAMPYAGYAPAVPAAPTREDELRALENQSRYMEDTLKDVQARIDALKNSGE